MSWTTICAIGDSNVSLPYSFRIPLYTALAVDVVSPNFVGSQHDGVYRHEGHSGFTSAQILSLLPSILQKQSPLDIVILWVGINDIALGVPESYTLQNIAEIVQRIWVKNPMTKVVLPYLPVTANKMWSHMVEHLNCGLYRLQASYVTVHVADTSVVTAELLDDQIHLTPVGYGVVANCLARVIKPLMNP